MKRGLYILLLVVLFSFTPVKVVLAQVDPNLRSRLQSGGAIVVDHTKLYLFDQIPETYLSRARNIGVMFSDRSVGQNTSEGLDCLASDSWVSAPSACRRDYTNFAAGEWKTFTAADFNAGLVPQRILFNSSPGKYSRANWTFDFRMGEWYTLANEFVDVLFPQYSSSKDVMAFQFSYLNVNPTDKIADTTCGFLSQSNRVSCEAYLRDAHVGRLQTLENNNPSKVIFYYTTSLSKVIGTQVSKDFNDQMRDYARNNKKLLLDFADIESHLDNGQACFYQNIPALCPEYTTEISGGHLGSVSAGKIAVAKGFWILMAQIAGWIPGGTSISPTNTPTPTRTATPSPTGPTLPDPPGDANGDGKVDGVDYLIWLNHFNQTTSNGHVDGDFNYSGRVDGQDYIIWTTNYN